MRYTGSKSKEFGALRKRLEDTKLQLDRALAFTSNQSEQLAAERYRDVLNMFNTLLLPDTISDKTEGWHEVECDSRPEMNTRFPEPEMPAFVSAHFNSECSHSLNKIASHQATRPTR